MASSYKYFTKNDKVVGTNPIKETVLNEQGAGWSYTSSAPNYFTQYASGSVGFQVDKRVFDITFGRSSEATSSDSGFLTPEHSIYNQFAKVLLGHDSDGNIKKFNLGDNETTGTILHNAYFINFSRSQFKDKISQETFKLTFNVSGAVNIDLLDSGSTGVDTATCNAGTYGKLFVSSSSGTFITASVNDVQGLVFYEAGIAVVSPYIFSKYSASSGAPTDTDLSQNSFGILTGNTTGSLSGSGNTIEKLILSGTISDNAYGLSTHLLTASYHSTTELNSTIYFCRAYNHEFNYSSNPTFLSASEIVVKGGDPEELSKTYITSVGLYSDDNQLLAVAKLSEPIMKNELNELIARVRIDF